MALRPSNSLFGKAISLLLAVAIPAPQLAFAAGTPTSPSNLIEAHSPEDLRRYQAAIDTDQIGKDYATYFQALVATQCPSVIQQKKKGLIVFFKKKTTGDVFPIVIHCSDPSTAQIASAYEILSYADAPEQGKCLTTLQDLKGFQTAVTLANTAGQAALAAASKCADGKTDVELDAKSCMSSVLDSFRGSFAGIERAVTGRPDSSPGEPALMKQGCTETLTKVFIKNFVSTGRFVVDGAKWVGKEAEAGGAWIKKKAMELIFANDNDTSSAALAASSQSDSLLHKLKSTNVTDIWQAMVQWGSNVINGFKQIFTDQLGCQVWSGVPMESTCLSPLSFHCVTCGQMMNMVCGTIGFLGSEAIMSLMTGFALGAAGRLSTEVRVLVKSRMGSKAADLAMLQKQLQGLKDADAVASTAAGARQMVDLADRIAPGAFMTSINNKLSNLNVSKLMDDVLAQYPGMMKVRTIHYQALGAGREATDVWLARLTHDATMLDTVATASKFTKLEAAYDDFAAMVARTVRASKTGKLSAEQIAELSKQFNKEYVTQVANTLRTNATAVAESDEGVLKIIDRAKIGEDGAFPETGAFLYKPGINPETLAGLTAKDDVPTLVKKLEQADGLHGIKASVAAGDELPEAFPSSLGEGMTYVADRNLSSNALERFSTTEFTRQFARTRAKKRLDATLGVNRDSTFIVIKSEIF